LAKNVIWELQSNRASVVYEDNNQNQDEEYFSLLNETPILLYISMYNGVVAVEIEHYARVSHLKEKL